ILGRYSPRRVDEASAHLRAIKRGRARTEDRATEMARPTAPPLADDITLVEALVRAAQDDAPLATFHGSGAPRRVGARAALASALRWASALQRVGARRGEPIAIMLPTSEDFVGAFFGAL